MELNDYQQWAVDTAIYPEPGRPLGMAYTALGLAGEAGEVANKVKKVLRDYEDASVPWEVYEDIAGELGDALWYLAVCADELGFDLESIAEANLTKLRSRKERGVLGGSGDNR